MNRRFSDGLPPMNEKVRSIDDTNSSINTFVVTDSIDIMILLDMQNNESATKFLENLLSCRLLTVFEVNRFCDG